MNTIQTTAEQRTGFSLPDHYAHKAVSGKWNNAELEKSQMVGKKNTAVTASEKPPYFDISQLSEEEKEKLEAELKKLNDSIVSYGKLLRFKYDEEAETSYVEVVDTATNEVVASLPPEFLIDLSIKMKELIGMFIDEKL